MAIIRQGDIHEYTAPYEVMLNLYPDQFVSKKKKEENSWIKINMDYFYTVGLAQYNSQRAAILRNYNILKGKLTPADYYQQEESVVSFTGELIAGLELPKYIQHYPIVNPPIMGLVGEKSKRPDVSRPKSIDEESENEEKEYYTSLYQQMVYEDIKTNIQKKLLAKGTDLSNMEEFNQQVEQLTLDKAKEYMNSYSSAAEKWANAILTSCKVEFNIKELFEEGFRDMLICNRQYYHILEDKTKTGFRLDVLNPKNVWYLTTPDKKYIRDSYAAGCIEIMELSEIIAKYDIDKEEIDHLRNYAMMAFFPYSKESNLVKGNRVETGLESVDYNVYDPLILEARTNMEARLQAENMQSLDTFLGNNAANVGTFGNRFVVTTAYWQSKKLIGLLTFLDKDGIEQTMHVDEDYHDGDHPQEISIEWGYVDQWYKGIKIGDDIYHVEPLRILDYCPIIGVVFEIKNTTSTSLIDLMKPLQILYNICMNQIYRFMEKDKGKIFVFNKRYIPLLKDADYQDSEDIWITQMEEEGIVFADDSPENLKGPNSMNQIGVYDMSLDQQMAARLQLALALKKECWELVGLSDARLGRTMASQTATATNTELTQSYAQTEPYFVQQEYIENQVLQAVIDVALYIEGNKPTSTIHWIDDDGSMKFISVQTEKDLKNRDIKLFITSRAEDLEIFRQLRNLAQSMLQNGVDAYTVSTFFMTNSTRKMRDMLKGIKEKQEQFAQQNQQIEQQKIQTEQQRIQLEAQQKEKEHQDDIQVKVYDIDTKANVALAVAKIQESIKIAEADQPNDPDVLGITAQYLKQQKDIYDRDIKKIQLEMDKRQLINQEAKDQQETQMKERKLDLEEKNITSKERMHKEDMKIKKQTKTNK